MKERVRDKAVDFAASQPAIVLLLRETPWHAKPSPGRVRSGNRLTTMRIRDSRRWVYLYRRQAEEDALHEARTRSFLGNLFFAVTQTTSLLFDSSKKKLP
jgi:hypothetical protein